MPDDAPPPDDSPVGNGESLMRRVLKRLADYDRGKIPPLQAGAFFPPSETIPGFRSIAWCRTSTRLS